MPISNNYKTNKVIEVKNGTITGEPKTRPPWMDAETGEYLTDQQLIDRENLYPLLNGPETKPTFDRFYQFCKPNEIFDPDTGTMNWNVYNDRVESTWTVNDHSLSEVIKREVGNLALTRYKYEVAGITFTDSNGNTLRIDTTRESQTKLGSVYTSAKDGVRTDPSKWKTLDGFVNISNSDMISLAKITWGYVQDCYDRESTIQSMLSNCTTINEIKTVVTDEFNSGFPVISLKQGG